MTRFAIVVTVLGCLALSARASDKSAGGDHVTRVYDVGFLTRAVQDHPFQPLGLLPAPEEVEERAMPERSGSLEVETVMAMMQGMTSEWKEPASIQNTETYIVVVHTEEVHKRMKALLETLRKKRGTTVTCTLRVFEVLGPTGCKGDGVLDDKEGDALLARLASNDNLRLVRAWTLTGFNGQRMAAWEGMETPYLRDYEAEVGQEAEMADPVVATIREGISFSIRPTVAESRHVLVDLHTNLASLEGEVEKMHPQADGLGSLEKPRIHIQAIETSLLIPDGGMAVLGAFDAPPPKKTAREKDGGETAAAGAPARRYLVVVRVKVREAFGG